MSAKLTLGLDLGLNNVGWALVDKSGEVPELVAQGVSVFESPLQDVNKPGDGFKSKVRGDKRRSRRTLQRRSQRKRRLYYLLASVGLLPDRMSDRVAFQCRNRIDGREVNPYALRARAVTQKLEPYEVGRAICHLNQRRGFLSPRELMLYGVARPDEVHDGQTDPETGQIKKEIQQTKAAMEGFPTLGSFLYDRFRQGLPVRKKTKRNKQDVDKEEIARRFVRHDRALIEQEFEAIWEAQAAYHPLLTDSLRQQVHDLMFDQIPIGEQLGLRGDCVFFEGEPRVAVASLLGQRFRIGQDIAHLILVPGSNQPERALLPEERRKLLAKLMEGKDLTWKEIHKELGTGPNAFFTVEPPPGKKSGAGKKEKLRGSVTAERFRTILGAKWDELGETGRNLLVSDWLSIPSDRPHHNRRGPSRTAAAKRFEHFKRATYGPLSVRFSESEAANLATAEVPKGYLSLSRKAIRKILPGMMEGLTYAGACARAGLDHANPQVTGEIFDRLDPALTQGIRHPLVRASVSHAVRVINQVIDKHGKPAAIHIELPRDLARGQAEREKLEYENKQREKIREGYRKLLRENNLPVNETNLKKIALWEEAGGTLPYEPDIVIASVQDLITRDLEIDHIVPRSHNFDNSRGNLALCTRDFNIRIKRDLCLYQAVMAHDPQMWPKIEAHVKGLRGMDSSKRNRILARELPESDFMGRHYAAIGYISKEVLSLVKQLGIPDVVVGNGSATGHLRRVWGLNRVVPLHPAEYDEEGNPNPGKQRSHYAHHAVDAIVIALTDRKALRRVLEHYRRKERGEIVADKLELAPIPHLADTLKATVNEWPIIHQPHRRARGELHLQLAKEIPANAGTGDPFSTRVVDGKLVRYDANGKPAQAYPLGNNHHVVIWERTEPNRKGELERYAEVVPTIEAVRRRMKREPVIQRHRAEPGWRFVLSLCKGDMVEMQDGTIGVVSKFGADKNGKLNDLAIWKAYASGYKSDLGKSNPYLVGRLRSPDATREIRRRIILDPFGGPLWHEGLDE